jgi:hypothetical protein
MERWGINEFFESIGGLVNATEKLLMWIVTFWSGRYFWLHIFDMEFGQEVRNVRGKKGVKSRVETTNKNVSTPTIWELL